MRTAPCLRTRRPTQSGLCQSAARKDYTVGLNLSQSGPDPDPVLDAFYGCASSLNLNGYCNPEVDELIEQQSAEADQQRRKQPVWSIECKLPRTAPDLYVLQPRRDLLVAAGQSADDHGNSLLNGNRTEDVWLDR